jgi:hypothetical protein
MDACKVETNSTVSLYITSFYFTVSTITTVGYGDIRGVNFGERVYCIF